MYRVRREEERLQNVKRREQLNWRCPHTKQKERGMKSKKREEK